MILRGRCHRVGTIKFAFLLGLCMIACVGSLFPTADACDKRNLVESSGKPGNYYYVGPNGSDGNNGSLSHPWATVQHAGTRAKPGDTVLIRGGVYNEGEIWLRADYGHGGAQGKLLTIQAYPGERPIFVNGSRPFIIECDYIRVEGLHFTNGKSIGAGGVNRNTIQLINNSFTGSGYGWGAIECRGNNILIEGNECDLKGNVVGTQGHCYYISHGKNIIVRNNIARGPTGYGIHIFDQRRSGDPISFERLIQDVVVEGNILSDSKERCGIIIAAYDHARVENVTVRNNVIFNNAGFGIFVPGLAKNVKIYNNTMFGNQGGVAVYLKGGKNDVRSVKIINNIFDKSSIHENQGAPFHVVNEDPNDEVLLENNLYWPKPIKLKNVKDSRPITGDPLFVSPSSGDFRLKRGSAAIDQGIPLSDVSHDKYGIKRPQNTAFDLGAIEFH